MRRAILLLSVFSFLLASCRGGGEQGKRSGSTTPETSAQVGGLNPLTSTNIAAVIRPGGVRPDVVRSCSR